MDFYNSIYNGMNKLLGFSEQEDYRVYLVRFYPILGIPLLLFFFVYDLVIGETDEAIIVFVILILFIFLIRFLSKVKNPTSLFRVGSVLYLIMISYALASNSNPEVHVFWVYLFPLPATFLYGIFEGFLWIIAGSVLFYLALFMNGQVSGFADGFLLVLFFSYFTLGFVSIITEHVREKYIKLAKEKEAELKIAHERIYEKSLTDPLTGVKNRYYISEPLENIVAQSIRSKSVLSLMLCDLDNFKQINDELGHIVGDELLKRFSAILKKHVQRESDVIIRYGGDEFLIVLPFTTQQQAVDLAKRIIKDINGIVVEGQAHNLRCSFGVAERDSVSTSPMQASLAIKKLINLADRYLYQAKAKGGHQIVSG